MHIILGYESSQLAAIDLFGCVFRADALEVDHRGFDVAVAEPRLNGADVHAVAKMVGGEGVPELVQEEVHTVRPFSALVVVLGYALPAVEPGALRDALDDHIHFAVGLASAVRNTRLVRRRAACASFRFFNRSIKTCGSGTTRSSQFFGVKPPLRFRLDAHFVIGKSMSFYST